MTQITGDDVRAARGRMSRKAFIAQFDGRISEAKLAGIENGRKIRADEEAILLPFVQPGAAPVAEGPVTGLRDTPKPRSTPTPRTETPAEPIEFKRFDPAATSNGQVRDVSTPLFDTVPTPEPEHPGYDLLGFDEEDDDLDVEWLLLDTGGAVVQEVAQPTRPRDIEVEEGARLISNSEIQTFKRCPRKWYLGFHRGLKPKVERTGGALVVGTRAHAALAAWYQPEGSPREDPTVALERVLLEDWQRIEASAGGDDYHLQSLAAEFKKEADLLRAMIEGYVQWLEETGADEDLEVIAPETPLASRLAIESETPVYIIGRLDVRMRRKSDGVHMFMDHKTVADMTGPTKILHMNQQMLHYHLLEILTAERERIEAGGDPTFEVERTDGAIYNMLRKVKRAVTATPPFYQRVEVRHNTHQIDAYWRQLHAVIENILHTERRLAEGVDHQSVAYPVPNDTCSWSCDFFFVCPMMDDGSRAEHFIEDTFVEGSKYDRYPELKQRG